MKVFLVVFGLLFLTGCEPSSLQKAQMDYICKDRGGVYNYPKLVGDLHSNVRCRNGEKVRYTSQQQIPEEFYPETDKD